MRMKRLLVVAYHYPPDNSSTGVLRTWKFTQYLIDHGWIPEVLTVPEDQYANRDPSALERLPEAIHIHRVKSYDIKDRFAIGGWYPGVMTVPDRVWPWYFHARKYINSTLASERFDAVFATYPHATALLIGRYASRRLRAPLVVDFRDPWVESSMGRLRHAVESRMEHAVLKQAGAIICNTPAALRYYRERYRGRLDPERFTVIPNGYDEEDFRDIEAVSADRFRIVHPGLIDEENRNPDTFLQAVSLAISKGEIPLEDIEILFLGTGGYGNNQRFRSRIRELGLEKIVQITTERMPYRKALGISAGADLLLVLSEPLGDDEEARKVREWSRLQVPAKLYEFMRLGNPILALASNGAVPEFLETSRCGKAIPPHDVAAIQNHLVECYRTRRNAADSEPAPETQQALAVHERRALTAQLADLLDRISRDIRTGGGI